MAGVALRNLLLAGLASLCCVQGATAAAVLVNASDASAAASADTVMQRDIPRLQALLKAHADVNAPQPDRSTALHWAAYQGAAHTAALLRRLMKKGGPAVPPEGRTLMSICISDLCK